jgi:hypothetical protein
LVAAVLLAGVTTVSWAADVPVGHRDFMPSPQRPVGWRGDGTGVFPGATPPTQWDSGGPSSSRDGGTTPRQGKGVLWRVTMPHQTFASPIVVKGPSTGSEQARVITLADPHTILAYDANTGKRLWYNAQDTFDLVCKDAAEARKMRRLYDLYHRHFTGGKSHGTPDTSGLDLAAEKTLAAKELAAAGIDPAAAGTGKSSNHGNRHPAFQPFNLVAWDCKAIVQAMSTPVSDGTLIWVLWSATRTVAGYEADTGKCKWMRTLAPHDPGWPGLNFNSPLLVDGVLVVRHQTMLSGLNPATGADIWSVDLKQKNSPCGAGSYSCETPVSAVVDGKKVVILQNTAAVDVKTGKTVVKGLGWPKESVIGGVIKVFGNTPFLAGPDIIAHLPGQYGSLAARRFSAKGVEPLLFGQICDPVDGRVNEDTGQSLFYDGHIYMNDSGTSMVVEVPSGKMIPRGISGPNGGYPGCNVAGQYFFNFDGAASCTVTTLGPQGKLVAINHLVPGYSHTKRLTSAQGHGMGNPKGFTPGWWKQCFAARGEGVIGWVGRTWSLAAGEMSAGPFFQGDRIYLRTHTELICLGGK